MTRPFSSLTDRLPRSGIRAIMDLAWATPGVIHLEVGDPNFPTPDHILAAAATAAAAGFTHYAPNAGLPALRDRIAEKLRIVNGLAAGPENVVVTPGSCEALYSVALSLLEDGDEILLPNPGWPNFAQIAVTVGATPVFYPLSADRSFEPDVEQLDRLVTPRTKVILVNTPSNPTGRVFARATVQALAEFVLRHDLYVISDECYEQIVFDGEHVSVAEFLGLDRTVVIHSFSKTYAMTGWRVGYAVTNERLAAEVTKLQEPVVSCASTVSMKAAEAALAGPQDCVAAMRDAYRRRRDVAVGILGEAGLLPAIPMGAFYVLADVSQATDDTYAFARTLIDRARVAVAPGEAFGDNGRGLVRVSLAADEAAITDGLRRLVAAVGEAERS